MTDERQNKLIELLVEGHLTIVEACKQADVPLQTYYEWRKNESKPGKAFNKAYEEALQLKVKESRKYVQRRVNELLDSLMDITKKGKNENAKVQAVAKLLHFAELDPDSKSEITINTNDDNKNDLLAMWREKQNQEAEEVNDVE